MIEVRNYIRGEWIPLRRGREIEIRNPADQDELVGKGYLASRGEAEAALAAANEALPAWSRTPAPKRGEIVERAADLLRAEQDDVARLLTREEGKTVAEAKGEIYRAYNVLNYTAGQSRRLSGITIPSELPKNFAYTMRQPLGVVSSTIENQHGKKIFQQAGRHGRCRSSGVRGCSRYQHDEFIQLCPWFGSCYERNYGECIPVNRSCGRSL